MKLRARWIIRLVALVGAWVIRLWMGTLRYRIYCADGVSHPADYRKARYLYVFWHEVSLFGTSFRNKRAHILSGHHPDAELMATVCKFLNFRVVRGSSSRGGTEALRELARVSRSSHLAITPDGPHGPRRRIQPGLIYLASLTGLPIVVLGVGYSSAWRARSWDRFAVPKPWSTATGIFAPAIHVPPRLRREGMEQYIRLVQERLELATEAAERWANGGPSPAHLSWNEPTEQKASA